MKISPARKREQIGSAMSQPNCWIRREEMMTATLPRVSASTCRKMPVSEDNGEKRGGGSNQGVAHGQ